MDKVNLLIRQTLRNKTYDKVSYWVIDIPGLNHFRNVGIVIEGVMFKIVRERRFLFVEHSMYIYKHPKDLLEYTKIPAWNLKTLYNMIKDEYQDSLDTKDNSEIDKILSTISQGAYND